MPASLPARANLEFIRKQSKELRRAFADGDAEALERVRSHLSRARQLSDDELRGLDLSLQEAQHALACEYGFGKWEELLNAVEPPGFEDLAQLSDREAWSLLGQVQQRDVVLDLIGAPDGVKDRLLGVMTERVGGFIRTEMTFAGRPPDEEIEEARQRILAQMPRLREKGWLRWPPGGGAPEPAAATPRHQLPDRFGAPLMDMTPDELLGLLVGADEEARREGIVALEHYLAGEGGTLLTTGLQLAIDGTLPELLGTLLERRAATILRARTLRAHVAIEGWLAIHDRDNPAFVQSRMESVFVEEPEPQRYVEDIPTPAELERRLRASAARCATPEQMVPFYRDLATLRRLDGLPAALALIDIVEDPVLRAGMLATKEEADRADVVRAMEERAQSERQELHRRHCMVIRGVLSIQDGDNPVILEQRVEQAGGRGYAEMAAQGFPRYGA